jgi:hypothetical protein
MIDKTGWTKPFAGRLARTFYMGFVIKRFILPDYHPERLRFDQAFRIIVDLVDTLITPCFDSFSHHSKRICVD